MEAAFGPWIKWQGAAVEMEEVPSSILCNNNNNQEKKKQKQKLKINAATFPPMLWKN